MMVKSDNHTTIVDGLVGLLENLSPDKKLDLISKLSVSVKTELVEKKSSFKRSFGAFVSE